jgi:hypothetical protein
VETKLSKPAIGARSSPCAWLFCELGDPSMDPGEVCRIACDDDVTGGPCAVSLEGIPDGPPKELILSLNSEDHSGWYFCRH